MKKYIYPILSILVGAIILGVVGFLKLVSYDGNSCDMNGKTCNCFYCHSFGLRGYESCGDYGFLLGAGIGAVVGLAAYLIIKKLKKWR